MPRVTIAGLGLIGGSLGMALRARGWDVSYFDPNVTIDAALAAAAATARVDSLDGGDLAVLAAPVDASLDLLRHAHTTLITSTCSVMQPLRAAAHELPFVAGHPFAGSERSGLAAARADLFEGKVWFVDRDVDIVRTMIGAAGARQVVVDPHEHDETLALTSHLPQVLSTALAALLEAKHVDPMFVGSGLRTLLRLAGSSYEIWGPVLDANAANVQRALDELVETAEQLDEKAFDRARRYMSS